MIYSMTGFGKTATTIGSKHIEVEIRSVNNKGFDADLKMPHPFREREFEIKKQLAGLLLRGRIGLVITNDTTKTTPQHILDKRVALNYANSIREMASELNTPVNALLSNVLMFPDVFKLVKEDITADHWAKLFTAIQLAGEQVAAYRKKEGASLYTVIIKSIHAIKTLTAAIKEMENERIQQLKERISNSLSLLDNNMTYDKNRFEQEMIYYIEKLDISEEKNRLQAHIDLFSATIDSKESVKGKRLQFISQEMGREINTMGSKAQHAGIQGIVVDMKDHLERIKEQLANVL